MRITGIEPVPTGLEPVTPPLCYILISVYPELNWDLVGCNHLPLPFDYRHITTLPGIEPEPPGRQPGILYHWTTRPYESEGI